MKRLTVVVLCLAALLVTPLAVQAEICKAENASDFKRDTMIHDFNDFAFIFHSSQDFWGCATVARAKLETKLSNMPVSEWQQWLGGGSVSFIMATGLQLGAMNELTASLDQKIRDVAKNYQFVIQPGENGQPACGFSGTKWEGANTCLEDYAMDASAQAWIAAYYRNTGRAEWSAKRAAAITAMNNMLNPLTSCIHNPSTMNTADPNNRGMCNGTYQELVAGTAHLVSLQRGEETLAYGVGQMTSFGSAVVAMDVMERPFAKSQIPADRQGMAGFLFNEASQNGRSFAVGPTSAEFAGNKCRYKHAGVMGFDPNVIFWCWDTTFFHDSPAFPAGQKTSYRADMFKVKPIYDRFALPTGGPNSPPNGYMFDRFREDLFYFGPGDHDKAWGPGRRLFYGQLGSAFVTAKPAVRGRGAYAGAIKRGTLWITTSTSGPVVAGVNGGARPPAANMTLFDTIGSLRHNDTIQIQSANGQWWTATNGGGSSVVTASGSGTTFTIVKIAQTNEMIAAGDEFALRTPSGHYLTVPSVGSAVMATSTTIGAYERFKMDRTAND